MRPRAQVPGVRAPTPSGGDTIQPITNINQPCSLKSSHKPATPCQPHPSPPGFPWYLTRVWLLGSKGKIIRKSNPTVLTQLTSEFIQRLMTQWWQCPSITKFQSRVDLNMYCQVTIHHVNLIFLKMTLQCWNVYQFVWNFLCMLNM